MIVRLGLAEHKCIPTVTIEPKVQGGTCACVPCVFVHICVKNATSINHTMLFSIFFASDRDGFEKV